jgi:hypothetical protein
MNTSNNLQLDLFITFQANKFHPIIKVSVKQLIATILLLIISSNGKSQSYNATKCPTCNTSDIAVFNEINTKYLGVKGSNPSRPSTYNLIGSNKAAGVSSDDSWDGLLGLIDGLWGNNWYPIREEKQILVGVLKRFGVHAAADENDWNIIILPDNSFKPFISEAIVNQSFDLIQSYPFSDDWYTTSDGIFMIEAEITPRKDEFNNKWFNNVDKTALPLNKHIGVYGPFVSEEAHGNRPEIHPSEQIWWKENDSTTMVLLVADASNRFDEKSDYDFNYAKPNAETWTLDKGQESELLIPFEIEIGKGALYYNIQALDSPNFYEGANYPDVSSSTTETKHTITYKEQPVLTIQESVNFDKYIGITIKDVCFNDQTQKLHGLIVIKTAIGNGGAGKEGFVALQIGKRNLGLTDKQGLITGKIIGTANTWTTYNNNYDEDIQFGSTIISSDKKGEAIVDGMIDFNGNGITDLFTSANGKWLVMYDAKGKWKEINSSRVPLNELRFGDVDGDKKTDVMCVNADHRLQVSLGGTARWDDYSNVEGLNSQNARVGDFNGDGKTDIIKRVDRYEASTNYAQIDIDIKYGCSGDWKKLEQGFQVYAGDWEHRMRFGDFNGDGITDIFRYYQNKFQVYYSGRGDLTPLCSPLITGINVENNLLFVKSLSKKGFTDIIYVKSSNNAWKIYYEGKTTTPGRILKYNDVDNICFGNFNPDVLWEPITMDFIKQPRNPEHESMSIAAKIKKEPFVLYNYKKGSIKSVLINNKPALFFDMDAVYYPGNSTATKTKNNFAAVSTVKMKSGLSQLAFKQVDEAADNKEMIGRLENIPLSGVKENEVEIKYAAEAKVYTIKTPGYGIGTLNGKVEETIIGVGDLKKWETYISGVNNPGTGVILRNAPNKTELIKNITWELIPYYSGIENNKITITEMPEAMKELNEIAYGKDIAKTEEIFGSKNVFDIAWDFVLTDLTTGQVIPIANPISLISAGKWTNSKITFSFPETNNLLQLKATATVKDKLGNKSFNNNNFTFYNQRIKLAGTEIKPWVDVTFATNKKVAERLLKKAVFNSKDFNISPLELKQLVKM